MVERLAVRKTEAFGGILNARRWREEWFWLFAGQRSFFFSFFF